MIIEWATSIINGIKQYSQEDSEVCLFGKILRNEIDEETIIILNKLKTSILDIIKVSNIYKAKLKYNIAILLLNLLLYSTCI